MRYWPSLIKKYLRASPPEDNRNIHQAWNEFFGYRWGEYRGSANMPGSVTFTYYGGKWTIKHSTELYWHASGGPILQYKAMWNHWRNDIRSMIYIMQNHPNLHHERANLRAAGKLNDAPQVILKP